MSGKVPLPCMQPDQSNRERWNLQYSWQGKVGPSFVTFLSRNYLSEKQESMYSGSVSGWNLRLGFSSQPHLALTAETKSPLLRTKH